MHPHPEYFYNLITVVHGGRVAEIVITFLAKGKNGALGVFLWVDLFSGQHQELEWVKSERTTEVSSLRLWCNAIALNRRMQQVRAGPYSAEAKSSVDWGSSLCKETFLDHDEEDNFDPEIWRGFCRSQALGFGKPKPCPKWISLSSLYPDCDLITNRAVMSKLPVSSMESKHSPIRLVYG